MNGTAYAYSDVVTGITSEIKEGAQILNQLLTLSDIEAIHSIQYWKDELQNATDDHKTICKEQIDLIQRNMIAKQRIIANLMRSSDVTSNVTSQISQENNHVIYDKDGNTLTEVKGPAKVKGKVITLDKKVIDEGVKQVEETSETTEIREFLTVKQIREDVITMLKDKVDENNAKEFAAELLKNGRYSTKKGDRGHSMNDKEFEGFWNSTLSMFKDNKEREFEETVTEKTEQVIEETKAEDEKSNIDYSKLASMEDDVKIYEALYGKEKVILDYSKQKSGDDEAKAISEFVEQIISINNSDLDKDTKQRQIDALTRLFFSDRTYTSVIVWTFKDKVLNGSLKDNYLDFLKNTPDPNNQINSLKELVPAAKLLVEKLNLTKDNLYAWFKRNVLNKKLEEMDTILTTEIEVKNMFNKLLAWLFKPKDNKIEPNAEFDNKESEEKPFQETMDETIRLALENAKPDDILYLLSKEVKNQLTSVNNNVTLTEVYSRLKQVAKDSKHPLYDKYLANKKEFQANNKQAEEPKVNPTPVTEIGPSESEITPSDSHIEESHPVNEMGEDAPTATNPAETVATEVVVEPESKEETSSNINPTLEKDLNITNIQNAAKPKAFQNAIIQAIKKHNDTLEIRNAIYESLKDATGKYSRRLAHNSKEDFFKQIDSIVKNMS